MGWDPLRWSIAEKRNPPDQPGRWITVNGAHVFIPDAKGGKAEANHTPHNVKAAPPSHAPGHENNDALLLRLSPAGNEALFKKHGVTRAQVIAAHQRKTGPRDPITHRQMTESDNTLRLHLMASGHNYDHKTKNYRKG